ncbi:MAG: GntR family transcriptional regulator [Peptococcaceae bacterium]|nr:GntR family transcriptional regulator [Peptococcaceae bacterium]
MLNLLDKLTDDFMDSHKVKKTNPMVEEEVYIFLRNAILSGVFPPDYRISEAEVKDLEERIGATESMIRNALFRLTADHLVNYQADEGFTVSVLELDDLREIYFIRSVLEGAAARLACRNISEEQLRELEKLCEQMEKSLKNNELVQLSLLNTDFHQIIDSAAKSPRLYNLIVELWNGFFNSGLSFYSHRASVSVSEHKTIYEVLKNRDEDKAETIVRDHFLKALDDLEEYWIKRL